MESNVPFSSKESAFESNGLEYESKGAHIFLLPG
jgi:hypothetical protein